jgi:lipoprotein-releasing system permease protein
MIATLGVIVGTMALFIVLSGFSGLKTFSLNFLKTSDPDFKITAIKGKSFDFTDLLESKIETTEGIAHYTRVIEERAFFEFKNKTHLAYIKGIEENFTKVNRIDSAIVDGKWIDFKFTDNVVIGNGISNKLSLGINNYLEPLKIYVPKPGSGYVESVKKDVSAIYAQPVGIFFLSEEIDKKFAFIPIDLAQKLLDYSPNQISAVEFKVSNLDERSLIVENLQKSLGSDYKIQTREQLNATFHKMLNSENLAVYFLSTLVIILFLVNLIGTLIIIIHDKKENIKTINSFGLSLSEVRKIYFLHGFLLSLFGLFIGLVLAIVLVYSQQQFGFFMITKSLPFPVELNLENTLTVIITIVILSFLASKIASSRIRKGVIE